MRIHQTLNYVTRNNTYTMLCSILIEYLEPITAKKTVNGGVHGQIHGPKH